MHTQNRREFLRVLGYGSVAAAAAALTFDVERHLWIPGERTTIVMPESIETVIARHVRRHNKLCVAAKGRVAEFTIPREDYWRIERHFCDLDRLFAHADYFRPHFLFRGSVTLPS